MGLHDVGRALVVTAKIEGRGNVVDRVIMTQVPRQSSLNSVKASVLSVILILQFFVFY